MHDGIEAAAIELFALQGFGAAGTGERAHAVGIAPDDGHLGAAVHQGISRAAGRSAVSDNQYRRFGEPQLPR